MHFIWPGAAGLRLSDSERFSIDKNKVMLRAFTYFTIEARCQDPELEKMKGRRGP